MTGSRGTGQQMTSAGDFDAMDRNAAAMLVAAMRATERGWIAEEDGMALCGAPWGIATTNVAMTVGPTTVASIEALTAREFAGRGVPYTVWTREHADRELSAALDRRGWGRVLTAPAMTCDASDLVMPAVPRDLRLAWVRNDEDRAAYQAVMESAWGIYGIDRTAIGPFFERLEGLEAPDIRAVLGWVGGEPVAGAVLYCLCGVAGIGWVGTLPSASRRGYGAAVTWRAIVAGFERGMRFASLQASPLGEPVYRRMGFQVASYYHVYVPPDAR